jgi:hypothetical protein
LVFGVILRQVTGTNRKWKNNITERIVTANRGTRNGKDVPYAGRS